MSDGSRTIKQIRGEVILGVVIGNVARDHSMIARLRIRLKVGFDPHTPHDLWALAICLVRSATCGYRQSLLKCRVGFHNGHTLKPDPYSVTPFMSSTLSFILSSKDEMCHRNVSPEGLESSFLFYQIFTDLHLIICTYHSL
jgi:hypothetical protein